MDKLNNLIENTIEILKGENGPAYGGIIGIVLIVLGRYGYKLRSNHDGKEVTFEPCLSNDYPIANNYIDSVESPDESTVDSSDK